ncbi:MAG: hypothetical protein EB060_06650 [Proteobacteria bacterium]|nr:hypothetical protein [Pseudomonadota bacterium]
MRGDLFGYVTLFNKNWLFRLLVMIVCSLALTFCLTLFAVGNPDGWNKNVYALVVSALFTVGVHPVIILGGDQFFKWTIRRVEASTRRAFEEKRKMKQKRDEKPYLML